MGIRSRLLRLLEILTNTHIYQSLPHGVSIEADVQRLLPRFQSSVVFDVGANVGQSARHFAKVFPKAEIFCFEPVQSTFQTLQKNLSQLSNVHCYALALGAAAGSGNMVLQDSSDMFYLQKSSTAMTPAQENLEVIEIDTVDNICTRSHLETISYLKIDTEGYDLEVLKGAEQMLQAGRIDLVEVEAGMHPGNPRHVPFEQLKQFLESYDYRLFGIYEQYHEWLTREPHLRRINSVFISSKVIAENQNLFHVAH